MQPRQRMSWVVEPMRCLTYRGRMIDHLPLAPGLAPLGAEPRAGLKRLASAGFRFVQVSVTTPGLRPRDLDESARRDLRATLRRLELSCSGLDAWVPAEHFLDPAKIDRAVQAISDAIELAASLDRCPVSVLLPDTKANPAVRSALSALGERAHHFNVALANHAVDPTTDAEVMIGVDPAAHLAMNRDPAKAVLAGAARIASARLVDLTTTGLRAPIGQIDGRLDVAAYQVALDAAGYRRPVVVDARQWPDPWRGLEDTRRAWNGFGF